MEVYKEIDLIEDLVLELADRTISSDYNDLRNIIISIKDSFDKGLITPEEYKQLIINALAPYPEYIPRLRDIINSSDEKAIIKILEDGIVPERIYNLRRTGVPPEIWRIIGVSTLISKRPIAESIRKAYEFHRVLERVIIPDASVLIRLYLASAMFYTSLGFFYRAFEYISRAIRLSIINNNVLETLTIAREILLIYSKAPRIYDDCYDFISSILELTNSIKNALLLEEIRDDMKEFIKEKLEKAEKTFADSGIKCIESDSLEELLDSIRRMVNWLIER